MSLLLLFAGSGPAVPVTFSTANLFDLADTDLRFEVPDTDRRFDVPDADLYFDGPADD